MNRLKEKRRILIAGREYWMTFEEVIKEFGKEGKAFVYEVWESAKKGGDSMVKKGGKPEKKAKPNNELAVKILEVMKTLQANGIEETNSTVLRDKVGTKNRSAIRRVMKLLEKNGKVLISEKTVGKRKQYTYRLA